MARLPPPHITTRVSLPATTLTPMFHRPLPEPTAQETVAAGQFARLVSSYINAGFTRQEAIQICTTIVAEQVVNSDGE